MVFVVLWNWGWQEGVLKLMRNGQSKVFLVVRVLFLKFQDKSRSGLYNKYMTWQKFPCAMGFILVFDQGWQGLVLKFMKNDHFYIFLVTWLFSPSFWAGKDVVYIKIVWNDERATCSCVPNCFSFFSDRVRHGGLLKLFFLIAFYIFLTIVVKDLARSRCRSYFIFQKSRESFVPNTFSFLLGSKASVKRTHTWKMVNHIALELKWQKQY